MPLLVCMSKLSRHLVRFSEIKKSAFSATQPLMCILITSEPNSLIERWLWLTYFVLIGCSDNDSTFAVLSFFSNKSAFRS